MSRSGYKFLKINHFLEIFILLRRTQPFKLLTKTKRIRRKRLLTSSGFTMSLWKGCMRINFLKITLNYSPYKSLPISEIYLKMHLKYPDVCLDTNQSKWKNSIRHNLSLHKTTFFRLVLSYLFLLQFLRTMVGDKSEWCVILKFDEVTFYAFSLYLKFPRMTLQMYKK